MFMAAITSVIFDLGNVLVRWNPRNLYRQLFPDTDDGRLAMESLLTQTLPIDTFNRRIDLGEDRATLCEEFVFLNPQVDPDLIRAYAVRHHEMWDGLIAETAEMHRALRAAEIRLYALSNWGLDFSIAEQTFPILTEFDGRVISHHVGVVKPDPEIFAILLSKFDLQADECLFVDDSAANISAAAELGFHTHLFVHPIGLRARLDEVGILPIEISSSWKVTDRSLRRSIRFANFAEAWAFMNDVAVAAEQLNHHPEWSNVYSQVQIELTTHDHGNTVTSLDRALAFEIDRIAAVRTQ